MSWLPAPRQNALPTTLAIIAALAVSFAGPSVDGQSVQTNRPNPKELALPDAPDAWQFVIFGDRTGGPRDGVEVLAEAVRETNLLDPDLVMTVGDLIEGYNTTREWMPQMQEYTGIMNQLEMPWFPVPGNHDIYWRGDDRPPGHHEASYERHFGPLWYWFRHENACFLVLYSDEGDPETGDKGFSRPEHTQMSPAQLDWLTEALAANREMEHVFVFLHHPRWDTVGSNWNDVHERLKAAGNVTAVFAGHVHRMYYSGVRDGIEYFTLAATGASLSRTAPEVGYLHHFHIVTVRKDALSVIAVPVGVTVDPRALTRPYLADVDRLLFAAPPTIAAPVLLEPDGAGLGTYTVSFRNPCQVDIEVTLMVDSHNAGWRVWPDHEHARIAPGEFAEASFRYQRVPGWEERRMPELVFQADYLGEQQRVSLPASRFPFELQLTADVVTSEPLDRALELAGEGACVRVASAAASPPAGEGFTLEGWVMAETYQGRRPILAKSENSEYYLFATNGVPAFGVHVGGAYREAKADSVVLEPARWYHLAGVYDGSEVRLYVDGTVVARSPARGERRVNGLPFYIGADPNRRGEPVDTLKGMIDEVRLSRGVRYTDAFEPRRWLTPDESTMLLFHADREIGPFFVDDSPAKQHGWILGNATTRPLPPPR